MSDHGRETILVVDDNAPNRLLAEAMLQTAGYRAVLAEDGARALVAFEKERPDLVLLDLLMPGMDGFETFKRLRALPEGESVPIVIVTALTDLASVQRAIELHADDFLAKPVNRVELLARIRALLGRRRKPAAGVEAAGPANVSASHGERERQREQLSAMVVHDLKHPLSAIYFNAGMLRRDGSMAAKSHEKVERILSACETLNGMIMTLLDINRAEGGSLPLTLAEFDAAALLDEVATSMGAKVESRGQTLRVTANTPLTVRADRDLLRRVLENLVENATKFAPAQSAIAIECRRARASVELSVLDEGPGIPAAFREKVFDKYLQLDPETSRRDPGSRGIGLAFCRMAVEAHAGKIWVEANEPKGTRFRITLPAEAV